MSEKFVTHTVLEDNISEQNQIRFNLTQAWFLRCSWQKKYEFLKGLVDVIRKREAFPLWCNLLWHNYWDKTFNYSSTLKHFDYPYDRKLNDNNRMLEDDALKQAFTSDIEWFTHVDEDVQDHVFLALLLMSGTAIIRSITNYIITSDLLQKQCSITYAAFSSRTLAAKRAMFEGHLSEEREVYKNILKKQMEWSAKISDYNLEIGNLVKDINNPKKTLNALDYVQVMPIYVAKKIFGYLDAETLKQVRKVNSYWEYVANSLLQDYKERANLNHIIKAMEEEHPSLRKIDTPHAELIAKPISNLTKLKYRGSCNKRIQEKTKIKDNPYHDSILQKTVENNSNLNKHHMEFTSFPRNEPFIDEKYTLLKYPECIKCDGGSTKKDVSKIKTIAGIRVDEGVYRLADMQQPYNPDMEIRPSTGFIVKSDNKLT